MFKIFIFVIYVLCGTTTSEYLREKCSAGTAIQFSGIVFWPMIMLEKIYTVDDIKVCEKVGN